MITPDLIRRLNPQHLAPAEAAQALNVAAARYGITDRDSLAAWLGNLSVESNLVPQRERMNYTDPARARRFFKALAGYPDSAFLRNPQGMANIVYAGRLGNGNVASGDGWRFRGAGMIQTTGRAGFERTGQAIGLDLVAHPELLEQYGPAALAAAAYWTRLSRAHALALSGDIRGTRRAVNGPAMLHADEMMAAYKVALSALDAPAVKLVPPGGGEEVTWDGQKAVYGGVTLTPDLISQLRTVYPLPGGPWTYQGIRIWRRQSGELVLERL